MLTWPYFVCFVVLCLRLREVYYLKEKWKSNILKNVLFTSSKLMVCLCLEINCTVPPNITCFILFCNPYYLIFLFLLPMMEDPCNNGLQCMCNLQLRFITNAVSGPLESNLRNIRENI